MISAALDMARARGRPALAVTFEPHPRSFFSPNTPQFKLTELPDKLRLLATTGLAGGGGDDLRRRAAPAPRPWISLTTI